MFLVDNLRNKYKRNETLTLYKIEYKSVLFPTSFCILQKPVAIMQTKKFVLLVIMLDKDVVAFDGSILSKTWHLPSYVGLQLKCDGTRCHTGGVVKGETGECSG